MADQEKSKSGTMQLALGLLIVTVIGLGAGFGLSQMFPKPEAGPAQEASANAASSPGTEGQTKPADHGATKDGGKAEAPVETQAVAAADFNPADLKDVVVAPFAPITSNIAVPDTVWIRLEGSMAIKAKDGSKPADVVQLASNKIVAYVKTLKLVDIQGPVGFLALNSDLNEIVRSATDGQARSVLISGFIVE
jgi:flagellar protein FliL